MAYTEMFSCDGCKRRKLETNHWFMTIPTTSTELRLHGDLAVRAKAMPAIVISPFDEETAKNLRVELFCGAACLSAYISQKISAWTTPEI